MDLGERCAYEVLEPGTPVYSSDGEQIGMVSHVLEVPSEDVFDGIVIETTSGGGGHRFVDADEVADIHEHGVVVKRDAQDCRSLPEPTQNPAAMRANMDSVATSRADDLQAKLHRAWDRISGKG